MFGVSEDKTKGEYETRQMECELDKVGVHVVWDDIGCISVEEVCE